MSDPERLARFEREARMLASLNHPNIATIHGVEHVDWQVGASTHWCSKWSRGRRSPSDSRQAAQASRSPRRSPLRRQIVEALEAAHEKGVVHRDLKPANIKIRPDGVVKVLDFGLAKLLQNGPSTVPNLTHSPTLTVGGTYPGVILGTAGYMSPEQAKGDEADQRSDIFSLGCILYEMLTGRRAFEGETASEILAGVLKSEVDFAALPARFNPRLIDLLRRCLEKNPKQRWHAAADVRIELEAVMGRAQTANEPRQTAGKSQAMRKRSFPSDREPGGWSARLRLLRVDAEAGASAQRYPVCHTAARGAGVHGPERATCGDIARRHERGVCGQPASVPATDVGPRSQGNPR